MKMTQRFRQFRRSPGAVLVGISAVAWLILLTGPASLGLKHCHVSAAGPSAASLAMLLQMNPLPTQLLGWGLMVVAMMLPKLLLPIQVLRLQSLKRNRLTNSVLFILGYLSTWMLAGLPILGVIVAANLLLPQSYVPAAGALAVALVWQFSPLKQRFLNRGHEHQILAAFGWRAFQDAFTYGLRHGLWCVGAGWALMLFPMLLPTGHNVAMLAMTVVMLSEHLENPRFPRWELNLRLKLVRYLVAQLKLRTPKAEYQRA